MRMPTCTFGAPGVNTQLVVCGQLSSQSREESTGEWRGEIGAYVGRYGFRRKRHTEWRNAEDSHHAVTLLLRQAFEELHQRDDSLNQPGPQDLVGDVATLTQEYPGRDELCE